MGLCMARGEDDLAILAAIWQPPGTLALDLMLNLTAPAAIALSLGISAASPTLTWQADLHGIAKYLTDHLGMCHCDPDRGGRVKHLISPRWLASNRHNVSLSVAGRMLM